jgi:hypothetical protein
VDPGQRVEVDPDGVTARSPTSSVGVCGEAGEADLADGARLLREGNGTAFVVLKVRPDDPPPYKRNLDPATCRIRFKTALLGPG